MPKKLPDSQRRTYRLIALVTKTEHQAVEKKAGREGISDYIRKLAGLDADAKKS